MSEPYAETRWAPPLVLVDCLAVDGPIKAEQPSRTTC